jgi:bifunctional DNA-binding transcriptional regulator/antitoxin component of YhaV-PrlF toxin-antitoxin module
MQEYETFYDEVKEYNGVLTITIPFKLGEYSNIKKGDKLKILIKKFTEEIKQNSLAAFGAQLRTVTQDDYLVRALSLPSQYGSIAKIYAEPEKIENLLPGESLSSTNLYVLAYDNSKKLKNASTSLKQNLKTYLSQYRVINDSIKIISHFSGGYLLITLC